MNIKIKYNKDMNRNKVSEWQWSPWPKETTLWLSKNLIKIYQYLQSDSPIVYAIVNQVYAVISESW